MNPLAIIFAVIQLVVAPSFYSFIGEYPKGYTLTLKYRFCTTDAELWEPGIKANITIYLVGENVNRTIFTDVIEVPPKGECSEWYEIKIPGELTESLPEGTYKIIAQAKLLDERYTLKQESEEYEFKLRKPLISGKVEVQLMFSGLLMALSGLGYLIIKKC